ncbi:hypothetical protein GCM10027294_45660 [Marinactinospora endophytica]
MREEVRVPVPGPSPGPGDMGGSAHLSWEPASYWLLYVVALVAALVHWRLGNHAMAVVCGCAVAASVGLIVRLHRNGA